MLSLSLEVFAEEVVLANDVVDAEVGVSDIC